MELLDSFSPTNNFKIHMDNKKLDGFIKPFVEKDNFCKNDCDSLQLTVINIIKKISTIKKQVRYFV